MDMIIIISDFFVFCCCIESVRLVDGTSVIEGRVEVYYDGSWGTVCDDQWDIEDADAVCRSLGYSGAESAPSGAYYGEGTGPIHLSEVQCIGYESNVGYCRHAGVGVNICGHNQDAGVRCKFEELEGMFLLLPNNLFSQ